MNKIILLIFLGVISFNNMNAQSISKPTMSSMAGTLRNGNITLDFTLGEPFIGAKTNGSVNLFTGFWPVARDYFSTAAVVYWFTGNGNFSIAANWRGALAPPNPLPANCEIMIDPAVGGQCVLDISYTINNNAKISVITGGKFVVPGNLLIQKP